jgi:hypothetical protein
VTNVVLLGFSPVFWFGIDFQYLPLVRCWQLTRTQVEDYVRFEVLTAMTRNNGVFWDVTPCGSWKNRRFRGTWRLHNQGDKSGGLGTTLTITGNRQCDFLFLRSLRRLPVTANVVPSSSIRVTLMMEKALSSSETSVLTRVTRRNIQEEGFLHIVTIVKT